MKMIHDEILCFLFESINKKVSQTESMIILFVLLIEFLYVSACRRNVHDREFEVIILKKYYCHLVERRRKCMDDTYKVD